MINLNKKGDTMSEDKTESTQDLKKEKKQVQRTESLNFKCEQFFGKNWKFVGGFIALALLVLAYELSEISSRMQNLEKIVFENKEMTNY